MIGVISVCRQTETIMTKVQTFSRGTRRVHLRRVPLSTTNLKVSTTQICRSSEQKNEIPHKWKDKSEDMLKTCPTTKSSKEPRIYLLSK